MHIGLIGAGLMGHGIARNLLKHGHRVSVMAHRNRAPVDDLVSHGASEAKDFAALGGADIIVLCVTNSQVVRETIGRLRPHLRPGQIIIDAGTSNPAVTRELAGELRSLGVAYADAPMTGGPDQAEQAELGILCGADEATFENIEPVLKCFASKVRRFGPPGSGHTAKLISNYLVTGMIVLVSEAFTAAAKADLDWRDLYEVMLNGSGNSGVLRKMAAAALDRDYDGYRFSIANAAKDIGYYKELAAALGCGSALSEAVASRFADAVEAGLGLRNVSHMLDPANNKVA